MLGCGLAGYRLLSPPAGTFVEVSVGGSHVCGLNSDGGIVCWGNNGSGELTAPSGTFTRLTTGGLHSCALATDGTVTCWGNNGYGQRNAPADAFVQISAGYWHNCGLKADGTVVCWGEARRGAIDVIAEPLSQVGAGYGFACGIRTDGHVLCWAGFHDNAYGSMPSFTGTFTQVSAGRDFACAIRTDATIACSGGVNQNGERNAPAGTFTQLSAGRQHACAVRTDGRLACWGSNGSGQLAPAGIIKQVSAGMYHTCALKEDGSIACWGYNIYADYGQSNAPTGSFVHVSAGGLNSCALKADGSVTCWGYSWYGVTTPPAGSFVQLTSGYDYVCGIKTDASVTCWGGNGADQLRAPAGPFTQISAGYEHTCGVRPDQVTECWGSPTTTTFVAPTNLAPTANTGGPYVGSEGTAVLLAMSGFDPDADVLTYAWKLGDGTTGSGATPPSSHTYAQNGNYTIELTVDDGAGATATATTTVSIGNVAPALTSLACPAAPLAIGSVATIQVSFTDPGIIDTHSVLVEWGDGETSTIADANAGFATSHAYATANVHRVVVTITDSDGGSVSQAYEYAVVYDPSAGFVTGSGSIESPAGAYAADPALSGTARFGFLSRYQKGTTEPTGQTHFQFHAAGLLFRSTSYQWLVVSGPMAQFKGEGSVNGTSGYSFILTATDGQVNGGGGADGFRIRISGPGGVVYDNVSAGGTGLNDANPQALSGGSIVIHAGK